MEPAQFQRHFRHTPVDSPESPERTVICEDIKVSQFIDSAVTKKPKQPVLGYSQKPSVIVPVARDCEESEIKLLSLL